MRRWPAAVGSGLILAGSALLAGCSALTIGAAVPADTDGPRPVQAAALHDLLLNADTVNDIMGAAAMTVKDSRTGLFDDSSSFADRDCMAAWTPADETVYARSGWKAVVIQALLETPGASDHFAIQAVVGFASRTEAADFFGKTAQRWMSCGDRRFVIGRGTTATSWTFDTVSNVESTLWMTQQQDDSPGWSCQRALRVSNNVAIDVLACKLFVADEGITIVEAIDARLPSV